jgi:hypothetical protein
VDRLAKNKCMFRFPVTLIIFNLHRRNIFLFISNTHTLHVTIFKACVNLLYKKKEKTPYFEWRLFVHGAMPNAT